MRKRDAIVSYKRGGRRTAAPLFSLAFAFAALGLIFAAGGGASASGEVMIGVDMTPGTNGSSTEIATCAAVQPGDTFDADIFISNAQSLVAWELRVDFNPDVVSLESADYGFFLTQGGGQLLGQLFDEEKPGRKFLAAGEPSKPDSGSGVLARLHLLALSAGTSQLTITSTPTVFGPRLTASGGVAFADSNGDGIFDGGLTGATVDVGQACSPSTPVVTPSPAHATATPKAGGRTPTATPATGGGGDLTPAPGDEQPTPVPSEFVINPRPSGGPGGADDASGEGSSGDDHGADSGGSADQPGRDAGDTGQDVASGQSNGAGDGSGSLILILAGAFATVAVLIGAAFLAMQAYWRR